jgi:hypothetical protein
MESTYSSETLVGFQRTTGRCIPEDGTLQDFTVTYRFISSLKLQVMPSAGILNLALSACYISQIEDVM